MNSNKEFNVEAWKKERREQHIQEEMQEMRSWRKYFVFTYVCIALAAGVVIWRHISYSMELNDTLFYLALCAGVAGFYCFLEKVFREDSESIIRYYSKE